MTTSIRHKLICTCGHEGRVVMRENSAAFSHQYEDYSLVGFNGSRFCVDGCVATWERAFQEMKPTCPSCGAEITQANMVP